MSQPNYLANSATEELGQDPKFVRVYNDSTVVLNGVIKMVVRKWITGIGVVNVMLAPTSNNTDSNLIGIVNNPGSTGIAASTYGLVQVKGLYGSAAVGQAAAYGATTTSTIAANDYLKVVNSATTFAACSTGVTVGGGVRTTLACAIAVELITTNTWSVYLLGELCSVA